MVENRLKPSEMIGLIVEENLERNALSIYVPGETKDREIGPFDVEGLSELRLGQFLKIVEINGEVKSVSEASDCNLPTRIINGRDVQIQVPVVFPPKGLYHDSLAWTPELGFVGCTRTVLPEPKPDTVYLVWTERVEAKFRMVDSALIAWQIADAPMEEANEEYDASKFPSPWLHINRSSQKRSIGPRFVRSFERKQRPLLTKLREYRDNYEGLVTAIRESNARVWSLAIPDSDVLFVNGAREGMEVGKWIHFNCEPAGFPNFGCYMAGKKFTIIDSVLDTFVYMDTVVVRVNLEVAAKDVKLFSGDVATVDTDVLGPIEFPRGTFDEDFYKSSRLIQAYKCSRSRVTGAVWKLYNEDVAVHIAQKYALKNTPSRTLVEKGPCMNGVVVFSNINISFVWTKAVGKVLYEAGRNGPRYRVGTWLSFQLLPKMRDADQGAETSWKIANATVEHIPDMFETRVTDDTVLVKSTVNCAGNGGGGMTATSDEFGNVLVTDSSQFGPKAAIGSSKFSVWLRLNDYSFWEVYEVIEGIIDNAHSTSDDANSGHLGAGIRVVHPVPSSNQRHLMESGMNQSAEEPLSFSAAQSSQRFHGDYANMMQERYDPLMIPKFGARPPKTFSEKSEHSVFNIADEFPIQNSTDTSDNRGSFICDDIDMIDEAPMGYDALYCLKKMWKFESVRRTVTEEDPILLAKVMEILAADHRRHNKRVGTDDR